MSKFIVGEYVVRRIDSAVGVVQEVREVPGLPTSYVVEMSGSANRVCGVEVAWTPVRTHAHITQTWIDHNDQPIGVESWIAVQSVAERCSGPDGAVFKRTLIQSATEELPVDQYLTMNQNKSGILIRVWDPIGSSTTLLAMWCDEDCYCDCDHCECNECDCDDCEVTDL